MVLTSTTLMLVFNIMTQRFVFFAVFPFPSTLMTAVLSVLGRRELDDPGQRIDIDPSGDIGDPLRDGQQKSSVVYRPGDQKEETVAHHSAEPKPAHLRREQKRAAASSRSDSEHPVPSRTTLVAPQSGAIASPSTPPVEDHAAAHHQEAEPPARKDNPGPDHLLPAQEPVVETEASLALSSPPAPPRAAQHPSWFESFLQQWGRWWPSWPAFLRRGKKAPKCEDEALQNPQTCAASNSCSYCSKTAADGSIIGCIETAKMARGCVTGKR